LLKKYLGVFSRDHSHWGPSVNIVLIIGWALLGATCVVLGCVVGVGVAALIEDWRERRIIREPRNLFGSRK
jgi:hypothetical protein